MMQFWQLLCQPMVCVKNTINECAIQQLSFLAYKSPHKEEKFIQLLWVEVHLHSFSGCS